MNISLEDARFAYVTPGRRMVEVFGGLSLRVPEGESLGIVGTEGSGKSTLLMLLAGLLPLSAGALRVDGVDVHRDAARMKLFRRATAVAFQFPEEHFLNGAVEEEVLFSARLSGGASVPDAAEALRMCGLTDAEVLRRPVYSLSVGEARRVALAALLPTNPACVFLDEPTAGLDASGLDHLSHLVRRLRERRTTVLVVSHDLDFLAANVERVIRLEGGKVVADGTPGDLLGPHALPPGWGMRRGVFRPSRSAGA
jgi:energy-coupling factor transport system ATP-binding protein